MGKSLSRSLFFQTLANRAKLSLKSVERLYEEMFLLIAQELRRNDEVVLPDIGKLKRVQRGGHNKKMFGKYVYVNEYDTVSMKPRGRLLDYVNKRGLSAASQYRKQKGRTNPSDEKLRKLIIKERKEEFDKYLDLIEREAIEKGVKNTNRVSEDQLTRLISKYTGRPYDLVRSMQKAMNIVVSNELKNKQKICFGSIGKFGLRYQSETDGRAGYDTTIGDVVNRGHTDAFCTPKFTPLPAFKKKVRELTEGNLR